MIHATTLRLTLAYMAIVMTISIIFSLVVYNISSHEVRYGLRRQLPYLQQMQPGIDGPSNFGTFEDQEVADAEHRLQIRLIIANLIIFAVGGAGCYWLARRSLEPIETALEAQGRFTADASHELRTPLTAMKTEIEVALRDKRLSLPEAKDLLGSNLEEVAKLEHLANGLLRLARYNETAIHIIEPASLAGAVDDAVARLGATARQHRIVVEAEVEAIMVTVDHDHLVELIAILLDNAIKYSLPEATVRLSSARHGHSAWLSVVDHGAGIDAKDLPHIFDRFYRADRSRTQNGAVGYGLGLSIARQIVQVYKGSIDAHSQLGVGTTFIAKLPLAS